MVNNFQKSIFIFAALMTGYLFLSIPQHSFAQSQSTGKQVELTGDSVEYSVNGETVIAKGHVVVIYGETSLTADKVEFSRSTNVAKANGSVTLKMPGQGEIWGDDLVFNYNTMEGSFQGVKIAVVPYYGAGREIKKVAQENKLVIHDGYMTTSDFDKPEFRLASKKIEVTPGDKMVARHVRFMLGRVPVFYLPKLTQRLDDKKPKIILTPGYTKDWGVFLLAKYRYYVNEYWKGVIKFDVRERKYLAGGIDTKYKIPNMGEGSIRTYYLDERSIAAKRFWSTRTSPTIVQDRYMAEWRHKWTIDSKTQAVLQFVRLSDPTIMKDYFKKEYQSDSQPERYFLLTRNLPKGVASFRTQGRINNFYNGVERLPEIRYDLPAEQIAGSRFYYANKTTFSNLSSKQALSDVRLETKRLDTDNELSYLSKIWIFEFKPFIGEEHTYYSKTKDPDEYGAIRGIFRTGATMSTKFYKMYDVQTKMLGLNINRLRHIITPTVDYVYDHGPTLTNSEIDQIDDIDNRDISHMITFSLENKLQTKRNEQSVDLIRWLVSTPFHLKENPGTGSFGNVSTDIDFLPTDWLRFYFDAEYDTPADHLKEANFDVYFKGSDKWSLDIGKRWNREVDDQLTSLVRYIFNPKWAFEWYQRYDLQAGSLKEQQYTITRDLHAWLMDLNFNQKRGEGSEIWLVFTLKAHPEITLDAGTSFNRRKAGSQSAP